MIVNPYSFGIPLDPDTQAFLTASNMTNPTFITALDSFVISLKVANLWQKIRALYPLKGGTASSNMWNLKDPRDLNAAFRLTYSGGVTYNSHGIIGNGTNAFANTNLVDSAHLSANNKSISMYIRNQFHGMNASPMGIVSLASNFPSNRFSTDAFTSDYSTLGLGQVERPVAGTGLGFFTLSKTQSGQTKYYRPGAPILTQTSSNQATENASYYLLASALASGGGISFSNAQLALSSVQDGITDAEEAAYRAIVETFLTALGSNV